MPVAADAIPNVQEGKLEEEAVAKVAHRGPASVPGRAVAAHRALLSTGDHSHSTLFLLGIVVLQGGADQPEFLHFSKRIGIRVASGANQARRGAPLAIAILGLA